MLLTIDIGNTNIVLGGYLNDRLVFTSRISTDATKTSDEYASKIKSILNLYDVKAPAISAAIISSVVPPLNHTFKTAVLKAYGVEPLLVLPGIKTGMNLKCDDPSTVGADLICACVASLNLYGAPSVTVDMGTATKIMALDKSGTFCGVSIIPGVNIGLKALASGTAQLPQISLEAPPSPLGKNTADCMRSGVVFGNASMIDGMIDRFFDEMGGEFPVIATGGLSSTIIPHCKHEIILDDELVLKGLNIIYKKNCR